MSETSPITLVAYRLIDHGQLSLVTAFLVRTPNGAYWAYPNEADLEKDPISAGALALDPQQLEPVPPQPDVPPTYLYRAVIHVHPKEERLPRSLLAGPPKKTHRTIQ
jgi:hypothetical protein